MEYASKDIRNILVAGHAGCGKTTLTESLLYLSGATERMGRVEDGTTASDFDPEEARRKASLNSSVIPVESNGTKFNLIDVPGLFDFETGAAEGITAAESVLICVSGRSGVTVGAEKAYKPPQGTGYIELVCMVPTGWQQMTVTYNPTFASGKSITFVMSASDLKNS